MIKVLGHRGVRQRKDVDENSLPAFEMAFKTGDGLETDVMISSDRQAFLCHETQQLHIPYLYSKSLHRLKKHLNKASAKTVRKKRIDQLLGAEIDKLCLRRGAKLPRLVELFNLASKYPGATLNIELKTFSGVEPVLEEINKAVAAGKITKEQIVLTSFDHKAIALARKLAPELKCGFLFSRSDLRDKRIWLKDRKRRYVTLTEETLKGKLATETMPDYFVLPTGALSAKGIRRIHEHFPDARIMIWTTKRPATDRDLQKKLSNPAIGPYIDTIITDFPDQMVKMLKKKGLRP